MKNRHSVCVLLLFIAIVPLFAIGSESTYQDNYKSLVAFVSTLYGNRPLIHSDAISMSFGNLEGKDMNGEFIYQAENPSVVPYTIKSEKKDAREILVISQNPITNHSEIVSKYRVTKRFGGKLDGRFKLMCGSLPCRIWVISNNAEELNYSSNLVGFYGCSFYSN